MLDPASLLETELFAGLSPEELAEIALLAIPRSVRAGEILFTLGEEAAALFVLRAGEIELTLPLKVMGRVHEVRFQTVVPHQVLAWSALVSPYRLTMSARAMADSRLLSLLRSDLLQFFETHPRTGCVVNANLAKVIGTRLNVTQALWIRELQRHVV